MDIHIISLPYDSARAHWRMGRGPDHFLSNGLAALLQNNGHSVMVTQVNSQDPAPSEIKTAFELYRSLATAVGSRSPAFPLVLSGNCGAAVGTLAGLPFDPLGIVWLDTHGDFNTPETTLSGYLDGMGLAIACGQCWRSLSDGIPGFRSTPGAQVLHLGGSDIEAGEITLMEECAVQRLSAQEMNTGSLAETLKPFLEQLRERVSSLYIHLDLDVLDPIQTPANHFAHTEGLPAETVNAALRLIKAHFTIRGLGIASYDPDFDITGRTLQASLELIKTLLED